MEIKTIGTKVMIVLTPGKKLTEGKRRPHRQAGVKIEVEISITKKTMIYLQTTTRMSMRMNNR